MTVKKITVVPSPPLTNIEKDVILEDASVHRQAAEIFVDANNKVNRIEVNLPPNEAQVASDKINANPSIATALSGDLIPGTIGTSGDQASYDALIALPDVILSDDPTSVITDNLDGTLSIDVNVSALSMCYILKGQGLLLPFSNDAKTELKYAFNTISPVSGATTASISSSNTAQLVTVNIFNNLNQSQIRINNGPITFLPALVTDTGFHTLEIVHEAAAVAVVLDTVEVFRQVIAPVSVGHTVTLRLDAAGSGEGIFLDFWRWTENV